MDNQSKRNPVTKYPNPPFARTLGTDYRAQLLSHFTEYSPSRVSKLGTMQTLIGGATHATVTRLCPASEENCVLDRNSEGGQRWWKKRVSEIG